MDSASSKISGIPGTIGAALQAKMCSVLAKNPALNTMRLVGQILKGDKETVLPPEIGINTHDVVALKYALLCLLMLNAVSLFTKTSQRSMLWNSRDRCYRNTIFAIF